MNIASCTTMEHHVMKNKELNIELTDNTDNENNKKEKVDEDDNCNNISIPKDKDLTDELVINNVEKQIERKDENNITNTQESEIIHQDRNENVNKEEEIASSEVISEVSHSEILNQNKEVDVQIKLDENFTIIDEYSNKDELNKESSKKDDDEVVSCKNEDSGTAGNDDDEDDEDIENYIADQENKIEEVEDLSAEEDEEVEEDYNKEYKVDDDNDSDDDDDDNIGENEDENDEDEDEEEEGEDEEDDESVSDDNNLKEDNDDVELILSSDEEQQMKKEIGKSTNMNKSFENDDEFDEDEDDDDDNENYDGDNDDLMNEVIMFSRNNEEFKHKTTSKQSNEKVKKAQIIKNNWDFRIKARKRSIKWLNKRIQKTSIYMSETKQLSTPFDMRNDVIVPSIRSNYDDVGKLSSEVKGQQLLQQQQQKQQHQEQQKQKDSRAVVSSKQIISIEIEDSPEKEPLACSSSSSNNNNNNNNNKMKSQSSVQGKNLTSFEVSSSSENNKLQNFNEKRNEESLKPNIDEKVMEKVTKLEEEEEKENENKLESIETDKNDVTMKTIQNDDKKYNNNNNNDEEPEQQQEKNNDGKQEDKENGDSLEFEVSKENDSKTFNLKSEEVTKPSKESSDSTEKFQEEKNCADSSEKESNLFKTSTSKDMVKDSKSPDKVTFEMTLKRKRSLSTNSHENNTECNEKLDDDEEEPELHPMKKLRSELQINFPIHNKILNEYIEKTSNNSMNDIQKNISQLIIEIQTLNDMIRANEIEWEKMIHLKKTKEELCYRLTRRMHLMEIVSMRYDDYNENLEAGSNAAAASNGNNNTHQQQQQQQPSQISVNKVVNTSLHMITSTPNNTGNCGDLNMAEEGQEHKLKSGHLLNATANDKIMNLENLQNLNNQNNSIPSSPSTTASSVGITKSILQSRANMKSADLAKERSNLQKIHRILVSRNILPKPSSSSLLFGSLGATNTSSSAVVGTGTGTPSYSGSLPIQNTSTATVAGATGNLTQQTPPALSAVSSGGGSQQTPGSNKTTINQQQQHTILNTYLTEAATVQQQLDEMLNGYYNSQISYHHHHHNQQQQNNTSLSGHQPIMVGRQGVFKDVKSIIADYRQKHPEIIPRRGRRLKGSSSGGNVSNQAAAAEANSILGNALKNDFSNSRPSSNDSSHSISNVLGANANNANLATLSFKDVLVQFAKMSGQTGGAKPATATANNSMQSTTTPPYPEVTLHPVATSQASTSEQTGSLLHGILTKYSRPNNNTSTSAVTVSATSSSTNAANQNSAYKSTFSPTLARLLTAPERITSIPANNNNSVPVSSSSVTGNQHSTVHSSAAAAAVMAAAGLNLSKVVGQNSEITITPVTSTQSSIQQTLLQQQQQQQHQQQKQHQEFLQHQQHLKELLAKERNYNFMDEEADDSVDRLVIDEGGNSAGADECHRIAPHAIGQEFHENEVPICQGCKKQEAQFVCAGCGNQWYCSRDCQVAAWDEHSEVCTG